jgi:hypothetical protein
MLLLILFWVFSLIFARSLIEIESPTARRLHASSSTLSPVVLCVSPGLACGARGPLPQRCQTPPQHGLHAGRPRFFRHIQAASSSVVSYVHPQPDQPISVRSRHLWFRDGCLQYACTSTDKRVAAASPPRAVAQHSLVLSPLHLHRRRLRHRHRL